MVTVTREEMLLRDAQVVRDLMASCVVYEGREVYGEVRVWLCPDDEHPYKRVLATELEVSWW